MATFTDITLLIDRSGSMASIKDKMESALKEFVQQHQSVPSTRLTAVQFDTGTPQTILDNRPIKDVNGITIEPRGGTALIDAICTTVDATGKRLASMLPAARPDQVLFVIISDGEENASTLFKRSDVQARITKQQNDYKWQFVYFGTNQDSIKEAVSYGINAANAMNFSPMFVGEDSQFVSSNTLAYASRTSASVAFTDDQRLKQATRATTTK